MYYHLSRKLVFLSIILFVTACASNDIYRSNFENCNYTTKGDCAENALQQHSSEKNDDYRLSFVEYDDQGQLRDRQQMNAALDEYREIAASNDVLLITFVHGWHHSAKPEDGNIQSFRRMLSEVSKYEGLGSKQQGRSKRKILGLYVGWRGDSISVPYLNAVTFWDRKNTAHDVGQLGVTELLLKLEEIVNVKQGMEEENPPPGKSRMVVVGHSFGGAVVFTSLQKILAERFVDSRRGKTFSDDAKGFGDLVVLMNPAFEALRFASLYDLSQESCRNYFSSQLPRLAILTSEADYATKYAFPAGRIFSTLFKTHNTLDRHYCSGPGKKGIQATKFKEGQADRTAVGHFEPFHTHTLTAATNQQVRASNFQLEQIQDSWGEHTNEQPMNFEGSQLQSLDRTTPLNPYLNIRVDKKLIPNHNDIWHKEVIAFIRDLIVISTTPGNTN